MSRIDNLEHKAVLAGYITGNVVRVNGGMYTP
jgi:hypothetical protein